MLCGKAVFVGAVSAGEIGGVHSATTESCPRFLETSDLNALSINLVWRRQKYWSNAICFRCSKVRMHAYDRHEEP